MKNCTICKLQKTFEEFGNNKRNADGKQTYCKVCSKEKDRKHYKEGANRRKKILQANESARQRNVLFLLDYLEKHPCVDCGEPDPILLDFDHLGDKCYNVSSMSYHSLETLQKEILKCEIRCVKCHRLKTAKQLGYFKYRYLRIAGSTLLS